VLGEDAVPGNREILRRLELDITRRLDGLLHGDHRGLVPGHGSELGETRRYSPGDDVRRIDWNVTARLQDPHIRQTIAERELETWLIIDRSARLDFGTADCEKRDLVLAAAGAIGFLTNRDGNRIGALLAGRPEPTLIPARGSRKHLLHILHTIADSPRIDGGGPTNLGELVRRTGTLAKRRGLMVVVSDFQVEPGWMDPLRVLATRHDVLAIEVVDPRELELPDVGLLNVVDPATGHVREVPTHKKAVRDQYAAAATARRDSLANDFRDAHVDHLTFSTDRPWLDDLVQFVLRRREHLAAFAGRRR
jgi:uncharacterized protein (DUF58 family)